MMKKVLALVFATCLLIPGGLLGDSMLLFHPFIQGPLRPTRAASATDRKVVVAALDQALSTGGLEGLQALVSSGGRNPYFPALALKLGDEWLQRGYIQRALDAYELGWGVGRKADAGAWKLVSANGASWLALKVAMGDAAGVKERLAGLRSRPLMGSTATKVEDAAQSWVLMHRQPEVAFQCGSNALKALARSVYPGKKVPEAPLGTSISAQGSSFADLIESGLVLGLRLVPVHVSGTADVPVPSIAHWKLGHFVTVLERNKGAFRVQDAALGWDHWMEAQAFLENSSGDYLALAGSQPAGCAALSPNEAAGVRGRGYVIGPGFPWPACWQTTDVPCLSGCGDGGGKTGGSCGVGMPGPSIDLQGVALKLVDTPLLDVPAVGPRVNFTLSYHQRLPDDLSGQGMASGLSSHWAHNWSSNIVYTIERVPCGLDLIHWYHNTRGGGQEELVENGGNLFGVKFSVQYDLVRAPGGPIYDPWGNITGYSCDYTLALANIHNAVVTAPSGWKEYYDNMWLSKLEDPSGNSVQLAYVPGAPGQISSITDATGKVTDFEYGDSRFSDRITRVTDPHGRHADMAYDDQGQLNSITDAVGLTTQIINDSQVLDRVVGMDSPYGHWSFDYQSSVDPDSPYPLGADDSTRSLTITDPMQRKRKAEFIAKGWDPPAPQFPGGMLTSAGFLQLYRNTFYWDEKAMADAPDRFESARIYHWQHGLAVTGGSPGVSQQGQLLESMKAPLEQRVFFDYKGQSDAMFQNGITQSQPHHIGRVLDDGRTQLETFEYNDSGQVTYHKDPEGRELTYQYAGNGVDLLKVTNGAGETLTRFEYNDPNAPHHPSKIYDAGSHATDLGYNAQGQLTSVHLPTNETTTLHYTQGFLDHIYPPAPGSDVAFTPDAFGRIGSSTDAVNGTLTYDYDDLDRLRKVHYPDSPPTYEEVHYDRLDVDYTVDRNARKTVYGHDAIRRLVSVVDPQNRSTILGWCHCGALASLTDGEGHSTSWDYDWEGRLLEKMYPDQTRVKYAYETSSSRLHSITDALGQQTQFTYNLADQLLGVSYLNAVNPTSSVAFSYEPVMGRLGGMTDGTGATQFNYNPIQAEGVETLGAGRLASVAGPLAHSAVAYDYDASGRVVSVAVNGVAETYHYNASGQLDHLTNPLGQFNYLYRDADARLDQVLLPNGAKTILAYLGAEQSGRLQSITHQNAAGTVLSAYGYGYDPAGQITGWDQQAAGSPPVHLDLGYDQAGQIQSADKHPLGSQALLSQQSWTYDKAGNRTDATVDGSTTSTVPNPLNQLTNVIVPDLKVQGTSSHPALVTVNGVSAQTAPDNSFSLTLPGGQGQRDLAITADDGQKTINAHYSAEVGQSLKYDLNGNMTSDGIHQYDWDAANRLIRISDLHPSVGSPAHVSEFTYDGWSRMVEDKELQGLRRIADRKFVWDSKTMGKIIEERDQNNNVAKRFYSVGEQVLSGPTAGSYYFLQDQLGSIRQVLDSGGNIVATLDYDVWGNISQTSGTFSPDFGFAGYFEHYPTGLTLNWLREYSPALGTWLSRDPIEERGGINLYQYADNEPNRYFDKTGRSPGLGGRPGPLPNNDGTIKGGICQGHYHFLNSTVGPGNDDDGGAPVNASSININSKTKCVCGGKFGPSISLGPLKKTFAPHDCECHWACVSVGGTIVYPAGWGGDTVTYGKSFSQGGDVEGGDRCLCGAPPSTY